jgi:hypothetical protein
MSIAPHHRPTRGPRPIRAGVGRDRLRRQPPSSRATGLQGQRGPAQVQSGAHNRPSASSPRRAVAPADPLRRAGLPLEARRAHVPAVALGVLEPGQGPRGPRLRLLLGDQALRRSSPLSPRTILARHRRSDGRLLEEAWRRYHELLGGSEENLSGLGDEELLPLLRIEADDFKHLRDSWAFNERDTRGADPQIFAGRLHRRVRVRVDRRAAGTGRSRRNPDAASPDPAPERI